MFELKYVDTGLKVRCTFHFGTYQKKNLYIYIYILFFNQVFID